MPCPVAARPAFFQEFVVAMRARDVIAAGPLPSQLPLEAQAADGFPIDPRQQKRARRAAIGYATLGLYHLAGMPFLLRGMRLGSLEHLGQDLVVQGAVLAKLLAYVVLNLALAACAWRVISMRIWTSWTVVGLAAVWTLWMGGALGWGWWRIASASSGPVEGLGIALEVGLLLGHLYSFRVLAQATNQFNQRRAEVKARLGGRLRGS